MSWEKRGERGAGVNRGTGHIPPRKKSRGADPMQWDPAAVPSALPGVAVRWSRVLAVRAAIIEGVYEVSAEEVAVTLRRASVGSAGTGSWENITVMGEMLRLQASDGQELSAYVARPNGAAKGGLVIVQEIFGVNSHIRSVVDSYPAEGYVAIAPALFDPVERGVELTYGGESMPKALTLLGKLDPQKAILDVAAAFGKVQGEGAGAGVIGFCYGGFMAWLSATRGPQVGFAPKCTVGYYAGGIGTVAKEHPSCPVMLHFGADDSHIGMDQVDAVRSAHPEVQVFLYEGAGHAFNRDVDPRSFSPEAAAIARQRTVAFLADNIR